MTLSNDEKRALDFNDERDHGEKSMEEINEKFR